MYIPDPTAAIDSSIFKAYDIRGVAPEALTPEVAYRAGRAFAVFTQAKQFVLGYDMRMSTPALKEAFMQGANEQGVSIWDVGMVSTDAIYYAAGKWNVPGVMITASHNPKQYNGIKFCGAGAGAVGKESGLLEIEKLIKENTWPVSVTPSQATVAKKDLLHEYLDHVLSFVDSKDIKPLKVVADTGNGLGGSVLPELFKRLPQIDLIPMYFDLDGNFPNHPASPLEIENVQDAIAKVKETKADLGLAFDGDADRVFFIDEQGGRVTASFITAMIAEELLRRNPGASVVYNVVCSKIVPDTIEANGGEALKERVGHSFIKARMKQHHSVFGGEHSGHYYYRDNFFADSAMVTVVTVLELLSRSGQTLSALLNKYQKYVAIEETNSTVEDKTETLARLKSTYANAQIEEIDGISFTYPDFWFNVRPSNTEPLLRLNMEARTPELLTQKSAEILKVIRRERL